MLPKDALEPRQWTATSQHQPFTQCDRCGGVWGRQGRQCSSSLQLAAPGTSPGPAAPLLASTAAHALRGRWDKASLPWWRVALPRVGWSHWGGVGRGGLAIGHTGQMPGGPMHIFGPVQDCHNTSVVGPGCVTIMRTPPPPPRSSFLWWAGPGENCQGRILFPVQPWVWGQSF